MDTQNQMESFPRKVITAAIGGLNLEMDVQQSHMGVIGWICTNHWPYRVHIILFTSCSVETYEL